MMYDRARPSERRAGVTYLLLAAGLIGLSIVAAVLVSTLGGDDADDGGRIVTAAEVALPPGWSSLPLSEADGAAGVLLSAERADPEGTFLARTVVGRLPADFDIEALVDETARALVADEAGFEIESRRVGVLADEEGAWMTYTQADGSRSQMVILPTELQTYYLVFRAAAADYAGLEAEGDEMVQKFAAFVRDAN